MHNKQLDMQHSLQSQRPHYQNFQAARFDELNAGPPLPDRSHISSSAYQQQYQSASQQSQSRNPNAVPPSAKLVHINSAANPRLAQNSHNNNYYMPQSMLQPASISMSKAVHPFSNINELRVADYSPSTTDEGQKNQEITIYANDENDVYRSNQQQYFTLSNKQAEADNIANIQLKNKIDFNPQATFKVQPDPLPAYNKYTVQAPLGTQTYFGGKKARRELLTLTIEIGDGHSETILIREGDDAHDLSVQFSLKHGLDDELQALLEDQIQENISQVLAETHYFNKHSSTGNTQQSQSQITVHDMADPANGTIHSFSQDQNEQSRHELLNSADQLQLQSSDEKKQLSAPFSESYQKWQQGIDFKLKTQDGLMYDRPQINNASKQMIEKKRSSQDESLKQAPVYERLYQLGRNKQRSISKNARQDIKEQTNEDNNSVERSQKSARKPPSGPNYGLKLYQRGVRQREEREIILQEIRSEKMREEVGQATFHPATNMNGYQRNQKTEELLMKYGQQRTQKIELLQRQKSEHELDDLDFRPQILRKSEEIVRRRDAHSNDSRNSNDSKSKNKFESLYLDAKKRNERKLNIYSACIEAECTFKPELIGYRHFNNSEGRKTNRVDRNELFERLSQGLSSSRERSQLLLANSQTLTNDLYDPETGQELFKPKVGRGPRNKARPNVRNSATAGQMLYQASHEDQVKRQTKQVENQLETIKKANTVFTNTQTNKIFEKKKDEAFQQIFAWLDSDADGLISPMKIDIQMLATDLLEVLSPLFIELEEIGQPLDQEEFLGALGRLYESLSPPSKEILLLKQDLSQKQTFNKEKHQNQNENFKPKINNLSRKIADKNNRGLDVSDRLYRPKRKQNPHSNTYERLHELSNDYDMHEVALKRSEKSIAKPVKQQLQTQFNFKKSSNQRVKSQDKFQNKEDVDLDQLAHQIATEMLQKHLSQSSTVDNHDVDYATIKALNLNFPPNYQGPLSTGSTQRTMYDEHRITSDNNQPLIHIQSMLTHQ